ncbi:MAG: DNA polymerase I [Candidatus Omnitrophica bacterium]|nr:DNA polymerase I [Candidatus Omnitrophota bacterium]
MSGQRLFLIDATAFCYRAFYAIRGLATSGGQPTNAVYGFLRMLQKVLKSHKPELLGVCFDVGKETFRHKKDAEYKSNRPAMPDELSSQIPIIKELVRAYGLPLFEEAGFEADDVIATLAHKAKRKGIATTIISADKDLLQLVDEDVEVLNPQKDEELVYDAAKVEERFGVKPGQVVDLVALIGDSVDNIPGIKGISGKTAVELIKKYGSAEEVIRHVESVKPERAQAAIRDNIERIRLNKELAALDADVDIKFGLDELAVGTPDREKLFRLFKTLEFKAFLKDLPATEDRHTISVKTLEPGKLEELAKKEGEVIVCGSSRDTLAFGIGAKIAVPGSFSREIGRVLADRKIKKTGHDLKALKLALAKDGVVLDGLAFDTMIAAYLCNPARPGFGLADIAWDFLERSIKDGELDPAQAVELVRELRPKLEFELKDKSLTRLFEHIEMPLVEVLAGMQQTGIRIDTGLLGRLSRDLEKRLSSLIEEIYGLCGCEFNINSPLQLRDVLFEKLKLPVVKRTKTGPSTDEEVLRKLAEEHALPKKLLEYRQLTKLKSTYIDALPQMVDAGSGRIHASFNQTGTETGRLSSSNPNLQNLPIKTELGRRIREAIIAFGDDSELLSCDYSQIELRVLAHLSGDEVLIKAFQEGKDIHRKTAALMYHVDEKDVTDEMRDSAKRINFGIVYGLSAFGLSRDMDIPVDEAQTFIDAYFATYPKVKVYIEQQIARAEEDGFVKTIAGRRRYLPDIKNRNLAVRQFAQRQAVNTPIQGSASDLIKMAMVAIQKEIGSREPGARMIMQVHDELVFDVDKKELKSFAALVRDRMENVLALDVPVRVDVKVGKNWSRMQELK